MFSSWFKSEASDGTTAATPSASEPILSDTIHPITVSAGEAVYGPLTRQDLEWTLASGFATETQTWYVITPDGSFASMQIIHGSTGLWYPTVQLAVKVYLPKTGERVWKSIHTSNFAPLSHDKRSSKSDQFSILISDDPSGAQTYSLRAKVEGELELAWKFTRPADLPGWKCGSTRDQGRTLFGAERERPDGFVVHRFWPRADVTGQIKIKGRQFDVGTSTSSGQGIFVSAIQGLRPNLVASSWDFATFQAQDARLGAVSLTMMEFRTLPMYGRVRVNLGSVVAHGRLLSVSSNVGIETGENVNTNEARHEDERLDPETGYNVPLAIRYWWSGRPTPAAVHGQAEPPAQVLAELVIRLQNDEATASTGTQPGLASRGLIEKVDVLAEIPYVIKKVVNYAMGTKPYIYQWLNPATAKITIGNETSEVNGTLFNEATFIS